MNTWDDLSHFRDTWWVDDLYNNFEALPPKETLYRAFELTPFKEVKCVILGQDPYHTPGMADGLAFSVSPHIKQLPPSLRNIHQEYVSDLGYPKPRTGSLEEWAKSGVLLLNTILTVEVGQPLSHRGLGWEKLTVEVISKLSKYKDPMVFILWGKHAQEYQGLIDEGKHLVLCSPHPSPFSANAGFFGSRPFSATNIFLKDYGEEVNWRLR